MRRDIERKNKLLGLDLPQTEATICAQTAYTRRLLYRFLYFCSCYRSFGPMSDQTAKNSRKPLTFELPPITDMVRPRGNALRLPSAAKSLSGFGKKIADGATRFLTPRPRDGTGSRWSMVGGHGDEVDVAIARCGPETLPDGR
jgi:hypothetical protein